VPWLKQWHNAPDEDPAKDRAGDAYATFVETEAIGLGYTLEDLKSWRPEERGGRQPSATRRAPVQRNGAAAENDAAAATDPAPPKKPRKRKPKNTEEAAE
jgi:hypothetical protein